jgi:hypothetical protein
MTKGKDYSLYVYRAYNLLKGVAEAYKYYTMKIYYNC